MDNFFFGLHSLGFGMYHNIIIILQHQLVWGFVLGFAASTIVHLLVSTEQPKHIPHMLTKTLPGAFLEIAPKNSKGTYELSYTKFEHEYHHVRAIFYSVILAFLIVMAIAMVRY